MATNNFKNKNVVVATDDTHSSANQAELLSVVLASTDAPTNEKVTEKEAGVENASLASKDKSIIKDDKDEKKRRNDLGISLDRLSLGPKKKLLVLPLGGILVHRAYRNKPYSIPKKCHPDFSSKSFLIGKHRGDHYKKKGFNDE
ncbi:hypothetical protein Tco_0428459 [Tanacetum coccineum]